MKTICQRFAGMLNDTQKGQRIMKAKFTSGEFQNARNLGNAKELVSAYSVVTVHKGVIREAVNCRFCMGRSRNASTVHCALWVHAGDNWRTGAGQAGGYGYHKQSEALQVAITSAGIKLYGSPYGREGEDHKPCNIGGCGESAMEAAFVAIARAAGFRGKLHIVRH